MKNYSKKHGIRTVRANRKQMPKMIDDKHMKRGDCEFHFSGNIMACKWMDNRSVLLLSPAFEGKNDILSVQRRQKGSKTKSSVPCRKVLKLYNTGLGGVGLMDQRTALYSMDRSHLLGFSSTFSLIWWILHVSIVTSFIAWSILTSFLSLITRLLPQKT